MSIITNKSEVSLRESDKCSFCDGHLHFPFLEWHAYPESDDGETKFVCICRRCCYKYGKGLRADLIQIQAIAEIEALYPGFTLDRKTQKQLEQEHEYREREGREILRQLRQARAQ